MPHYRYTTHAKGYNTVQHHSCPLVQDFDPNCTKKLYSWQHSNMQHSKMWLFWLPWQVEKINAFKCNLKELTTKSTLSAWGQRSLKMRMPSSRLHRSCDSLAHSVFLRAKFCQPFSSPPPRLCWFFSTDVFSVTDACSFPFMWELMAGLCCCASHGGIVSI